LGDLAALRWSNIDLARGELRFVTAKTGRRMIIPLSDGLRAHIASLAPSDQTDAVIHPRSFAILEAQGNSNSTIVHGACSVVVRCNISSTASRY
jgi:integrase